MDLKLLVEALNKIASEETIVEKEDGVMDNTTDADGSTDEFIIKPVISFERLAGLLFKEEDLKVGRLALRKILLGKEEKLTLRERNTTAFALINILPAIAGDRTVFNRIERRLSGD
jgi:hypothetical protein